MFPSDRLLPWATGKSSVRISFISPEKDKVESG